MAEKIKTGASFGEQVGGDTFAAVRMAIKPNSSIFSPLMILMNISVFVGGRR